MTEQLDWDTVLDEIEPLAIEFMESVQNNFDNPSEIGEVEESGGTGWDITVTNSDGKTVVIRFSVVDSVEYEGEMYGYNISVDAVTSDGEILIKHTPNNYTEDVWTNDITELKSRTKNLPEVQPTDLS